jgi:hypothetical protein
MANLQYGYRSGQRTPRPVRIDSTSADISIGDMLALDTAGYFEPCAAGGEPICVAMQACSAGSADGDVTILADFSQDSVYCYPADSGETVTVALIGKTFDVGGAQSANTDTGTDDSLYCVDVDTSANTVFVQIRPTVASVD